MTLRIVIVDDEELSRRGICARLQKQRDIEIVGEAADAREAIKLIRKARPDLVFLDVQLPGKTGFEVIRGVGEDAFPMTIFVTAHDRFALNAFEVHALDYLLKPIDDQRFEEAVERARGKAAQQRESALGRKLKAFIADMNGSSPCANESPQFVVRSSGRMVFVQLKDIHWIESAGDYVNLHSGKKTWLVRETMSSIEARLKPQGFVRIHRTAIVNAGQINEITALDNGDCHVILKDGTRLRSSRTFQHALLRLAADCI